MVEATTPPNPANPGARISAPDPTLQTVDALRREVAMIEKSITDRLGAAAELNQERFGSIDRELNRAIEHRREQRQDTKEAVAAALDAQKEATAKMEKSISDQIEGLRRNFETSFASIQAGVADLKDRLTILESVKVGQGEQKSESRAITAGQLAMIGSAIGVILFVMAIIAFFGSGA